MVLEFDSTVNQARPQQQQQQLHHLHHDPIVSAHSIIDNTLAQACNRKRRLSTPSLSNCSTTEASSSSTTTLSLKMSKSDSTIMDRLLRMRSSSSTIAASSALLSSSSSAPNRLHQLSSGSSGSFISTNNVVMIVSEGFPSSLSMESSSTTTTTTSSSSNSNNNEQFIVKDINQPYHDSMMCPDTLIKSILFNYCSSRDAASNNGNIGSEDVCVHDDDNDDQQAVVDVDANESCNRAQQHRRHKTIRRMPSLLQPLHETEFLHPTEEQIAAYNTHIIAAVRASDIPALRTMHDNGQTLGCCNRYGESILHMACRRSNAHVVSFLLKEANVSPRIKDDHGRTPLHDACWRGTPEFSIVKLLLSVEPRLAFAKDVWGHTPFQYARKEHWGVWNEFLDRNRDLILS